MACQAWAARSALPAGALSDGICRPWVASGFTLSQLGFVLATIGGLTILGEERTGRERTAVAAGVAAAVVGLVLMGLATGMDTGASPSQ